MNQLAIESIEDKELEYFLMKEELSKLISKREMWDRKLNYIEIQDVYNPQLPVILSALDQINQEIRILKDQITFLQYSGT